MKKFVALSLSCLLAASLAVFVGCGGNGTIPGNYKVVTTDEDWNKAAAALNSQTIFGDQEDGNRKFGLDYNADFNLSMKTEGGKATYAGNLDFLYAFAQSEPDSSNMAGAGRADFSINLPAASEEVKQTSSVLNGNFYFDNENIYFDGAISEGESELSGKYYIDFSQILGSIGDLEGMLPLSDELPSTGESSSAPDADAAALKAEFDEMNLKLEADFSEGTKLKITATDKTFDVLAKKIISNGMRTYDFESCIFEIYLQVDKNGAFVASLINFNIDLNLYATPITDFTLKGSVSIKATTELPVLPDDLDTYKNLAAA